MTHERSDCAVCRLCCITRRHGPVVSRQLQPARRAVRGAFAHSALHRPLLQLLVSPFNLFVFGLLTPLTDALLILWAAAWVKNLSLHYWEAVLTALLISLAYYPYSVWKKRKLAGMPVA